MPDLPPRSFLLSVAYAPALTAVGAIVEESRQCPSFRIFTAPFEGTRILFIDRVEEAAREVEHRYSSSMAHEGCYVRV